MKIIEPKVELQQQGGDAKAHIARCARVCYGRTSGNDEATIKRLIDSEQKKYTEAIYKYRTNTGKMTASDYTHLFGYLNPYYRSAYNIPKRRK